MRLHFQRPFKTVFCIFNIETDCGETVANKVGRSPILFRFRLLSDFEQKVDSLFKRFESLSVVASHDFSAHTEDVDEKRLEQVFQLVDVVLCQCRLSVVHLVDYLAGVEKFGDNDRRVEVIVDGIVAFLRNPFTSTEDESAGFSSWSLR